MKRMSNQQLFDDLRRELAQALAASENGRQVIERARPFLQEIEQRLCPSPPHREETE